MKLRVRSRPRKVVVWFRSGITGCGSSAVSGVACRYTDCIEVQAGLLTPLVWLFAAGILPLSA